VVAPDVGGGFGVKIMHPWPEEVLVPWAAIRLGREVKWAEDRREHFVASAHERGQRHHVEVGFDDDGRLLGLDVRFVHDNGAYTPYGIIVPIITATQLLGPYKPGAWASTGPGSARPTSSSPTRCPTTTTSSSRTGGR
jgi:CO/xanthine dehydrogenase Mo-binding subunit